MKSDQLFGTNPASAAYEQSICKLDISGYLLDNYKIGNLEDYTILGTNEWSVMIANQLRTKGYKVNQINQKLTSKAIKDIQTKYIVEVNDKKIKIIDQLKNTTQKQKINDFTKKIQTLTLKESIH